MSLWITNAQLTMVEILPTAVSMMIGCSNVEFLKMMNLLDHAECALFQIIPYESSMIEQCMLSLEVPLELCWLRLFGMCQRNVAIKM